VSVDQVAAALLIGALLGAFAGYWLSKLEITKEAEMSYRDLHGHVHARLGLKPPKKET
jgi:hypothetical protein